MTAHRVRMWYSTAGAASFHPWLDTWLTNMGPWAADEVTNGVPESTTTAGIDGSGTEHYRVELAFDWNEDKAIIMDQLTGYLGPHCEWHQLAYHVCTHDDEDATACEWTDVDRGGSVPSDIPTIEVGA